MKRRILNGIFCAMLLAAAVTAAASGTCVGAGARTVRNSGRNAETEPG